MSGRVVVPEGMVKATCEALGIEAGITVPDSRVDYVRRVIGWAIEWLSENPIIPTDEQCRESRQIVGAESLDQNGRSRYVLVEWQRRMFLAAKPEVPEAVKDLWEASPTPDTKRRVLEAYERGRRGNA